MKKLLLLLMLMTISLASSNPINTGIENEIFVPPTYRVFVRGNTLYLIRQDGIEYEAAAKDVLVVRYKTTSTDFYFKGVNGFPSKKVSLNQLQKEDGSAYGLAEFVSFRDTELKKSGTAGGGGSAELTADQTAKINAVPTKLAKSDKATQTSINDGTDDDKYINSALFKSNTGNFAKTNVDEIFTKNLSTNKLLTATQGARFVYNKINMYAGANGAFFQMKNPQNGQTIAFDAGLGSGKFSGTVELVDGTAPNHAVTKRQLDLKKDSGSKWIAGKDYTNESFYFTPTQLHPIDNKGNELDQGKTYLGVYSSPKTAHTSLTLAEIALIEVVNFNVQVDPFDNGKLLDPSKQYKANEVFYFEAQNGWIEKNGKTLKSNHGYFGVFDIDTTIGVLDATTVNQIRTLSNGGSLFRDRVNDIIGLKAIKNPSDGETRQVGTGSKNNTIFYTFNFLATAGETANDGTVGKWIKTADPTKRILALSNSKLGYENYNAGFTLESDLENYQYKQITDVYPNVSITHNDPATSSGGALEITGQYRVYAADDFISVNAESPYRMVMKAKTTQASANGARSYLGVIPYDTEKNQISHSNVNYRGSALTTLTQDVNLGDTEIHVADATGWGGLGNNANGVNLWQLQPNGEYAYNHTGGKQYDELGYTRWSVLGMIDATQPNLATNTVKLKKPWNMGTFVAGTKIAPNNNGGTYVYYIVGSVVPNDGKYHTYNSAWKTGEGKPQDNSGNDNAGQPAVRNGTSFVKILGLFNYGEGAASAVHTKYSIIGFEKGNSSNVNKLTRVKYIGSSTTFAGLPLKTLANDDALAGDYARLTADDGVNLAGIYYYNDNNTYSFGYAVPTNVLELTDLEMLDFFEEKKGLSSPRQISDLITKKINEKVHFAPDNVTASTILVKRDALIYVGNGGGIWRNETGGDALFNRNVGSGFNRKDYTSMDLLTPFSEKTHNLYNLNGKVSFETLDTWYDAKNKEVLPDYPTGTAPVIGTKYIALAPSNTNNETANKRYVIEAKSVDLIPTTLNSTWWDDATKMEIVGQYVSTGSKFGTVSNGGTKILNTKDINNSQIVELIIPTGATKTFWFMHPPANLTLFNDFTDGLVTRLDQANKVVIQVGSGVTLRMTKTGNGGEITLTRNEAGAGLRKSPIPLEADIKFLTAKEYQKILALDTKNEFVFKKTANLTADEIADTQNIADNAGTGKWVKYLVTEDEETLILSKTGWGGSTNHTLLNGKTWTEIKSTYDKVRVSAYSPRYNGEPVAWGYTVDINVIKNGVNLFESTDSGVARLKIADITNGNIYNNSSSMAASDVKIYGVKNTKTIVKPTELKLDNDVVDGDLLTVDLANRKLVKYDKFSLVSGILTTTMGVRSTGQYFDIGWSSKWNYTKIGKVIPSNSFYYTLDAGVWELEMNLVQVESTDWIAGWWESNGSKVGNTGTSDVPNNSAIGPTPARAFIEVPVGQTRNVKFKITDTGTPQKDANSTGGCTFYIKKIK